MTLVLSVGIFVVIFTLALKYRRRPDNELAQEQEPPAILEAGWIIVPCIIMMGIFVCGSWLYFHLARVPDDVNEVVEALRGVCLNLVYAHGGRAPLLVTITSPGAGDGKSFISANLAHTFADGGHRTLLIDADIRRGVLHRRLSVRRRPGLSDFLRGEAQLDAIVQATQFPALSLIGCGTRAYNAPELLGSPAMTSLVNGLRGGYDVVLIDSPPLAAGVDPLILSTLTGTMALVLRTGYSHRDVAAAKLEVLQRLPVRMLGAVLNDVPAGGAYRYYSYYLPGYEAMDENSGTPRVPV